MLHSFADATRHHTPRHATYVVELDEFTASSAIVSCNLRRSDGTCVADPIVRSGFTPGSCPWEPRQPLVATSRLRTSYDCKEPETSQVLNVPPKRGALLAWCDD